MSSRVRFAGMDCLDPASLAEFAGEAGLPNDWVGRANGFRCPLGGQSGEGWILMTQSDLRSLDKDKFYSLDLIVDEYDRSITMPSLMVARGMSMFAMDSELDDQPMLVRLVDKRAILGMSTIGRIEGSSDAGCGQYNVRYPYADNSATGANLYYAESIFLGSPWTWQTMLQDLWQRLSSSIAGTCPTLPSTPSDPPENFRFLGVSAWDAIQQVLAKLNCAIQYNPVTDAFAFVSLTVNQTGLSAAITSLDKYRNYNYFPTQGDASRLPQTVRVFFQRSDAVFGAAKDSTRIGNIAMTPYFSVDISTGITGAISGTVMPIWDDMTAVVDADGTISSSNRSVLNARANDQATAYVSQIVKAQTRYRLHLNGWHQSILPGSQISEVAWYDLGGNLGAITEIHRNELLSGSGAPDTGSAENLMPPDIGRGTKRSNSGLMVRGDGNIPPAEGTTTVSPGSATVNLYVFDGTSWVDSGEDIKVYNYAPVYGNKNELIPCSYVNGVPCVALVANYIWHVTAPGVASGGTTGVTLPDGRTVTATAIGSFTSGDSAGVFEDLTGPSYWLFGSGGTPGDSAMALVSVYSGGYDETNCTWSGKVIQDLSANPSGYCSNPLTNGTDCKIVVLNSDIGSFSVSKATLTVGEIYLARRIATIGSEENKRDVYVIRIEDNFFYHLTMIAPGVDAGGNIPITLPTGATVTAYNHSLTVRIEYNDKCYVAKDLTDNRWYLWKSGGGGSTPPVNQQACVLEGFVLSAFAKQNARFPMQITRAYQGTSVTIDVTPGQTVLVENYLRGVGIGGVNGTENFLFEGEINGCARAAYDETTGLYRADWVECAKRSPVNPNGSPGETSQVFALFDFGGGDPSPYYYGDT